MYTFCPGCCTTYKITVDHLGTAGGKVRCGGCRHVYNAVDYLFDTLPLAREALFVHRTALAEEKRVAERAANKVVEKPSATLAETGWRQHNVIWKDVVNGAGIGLLVLVLGLQWIYFNRDSLAAELNWRPAIQAMCDFTGCDMPLQVDLARIELVNRDVRKHPDVDNALLVNATFTNKAYFVQPYPVFEISFSDLAGEPVAMRRFHPAEYLAENTDIGAGLPAERPVQVVFELQDPGDKATSFQFGFL